MDTPAPGTAPSHPVVAVSAEASREVDPEIASFSVTVTSAERVRAEMIAKLSLRTDEVRALLDEYAAAIEKRETSRLSAWGESKRSGNRVVGFRGQLTTTVTVHDLDVLGDLMLRVADIEQTSVDGPHWMLRPASPVYREIRRAAVAEAIARAHEYADALGARVIALVELSDSGISTHSGVLASLGFAKAKGWAPSSSAQTPEIDLEPQRQRVHMQIEGRFQISAPTALAPPQD